MSDLVWTPVKIKLGQIRQWKNNPRYSTKKDAANLVKSLKDFGQPEAFSVSPFDGNMVDLYNGHQRTLSWMASKGADFEVWAMQSNRPLTEREKEKLTIFLHTGAVGRWNWDALSGWSAADLREWGMDEDTLKGWQSDAKELTELLNSEQTESADVEPQIDRAEELREKWGVKLGDMWQVGEHRIVCGDSSSEKVWSLLFSDTKKAQLTWTDPPYGVSYGDKLEDANPMGYRVRKIQNDDLLPEDLEKLIRNAFINCAAYSVAGASIYVASPPGTLLPSLIRAFDGSGYDFRWGLIWKKDQIVLSRADYHFDHENILYGWKPDGAHYFTDDRKQKSVFEYPRPKKSDEHPTMKPVELVSHMIRNSSRAGDIVSEPFSGSGTTMLASAGLGRICRAVELEPKYVAVALERMAQAFPGIEIKRIDGTP